MAKTKKFGNRYPWVEWFARDAITLKRGWHFSCNTSSFALILRRAADRMGVTVTVTTPADGTVKVEVTGRARAK